ncbi:hypothetical protein [Synechococcus phage Ssp-JY42]|nr:hypothetical protein [Synechococcus phage Yong-M4-211]
MTKDLTEIVHAWIREDLDVGAKLSIGYYGPALIERLKPIEELIQRLEGERDEAIRFMSQYAREAGEAKGRLEMSEAAGIVDGWRERTEAAEQALSASQQEVERLKKWRDENLRQLIAIRMVRPTHEDLCRLSVIFGRSSDLRTDQDIRINEWLKAQIADASALQAGGKEHG